MNVIVVYKYKDGKLDSIHGLFKHRTTARKAIKLAEDAEADRLKHDTESEVRFTYSYDEEGLDVNTEETWDWWKW